jgi:hypothetical protein
LELDRTFDLGRLARLPGTAKPGIGIVSRFYGRERVEDEELRNHLLSMPMQESDLEQKVRVMAPAAVLKIREEIPDWFQHMLRHDERTLKLWQGKEKLKGDRTRSGYDFSLTKRLLTAGHRDVDDLATILAKRPEGAAQNGGKGDDYIKRTIANALLR